MSRGWLLCSTRPFTSLPRSARTTRRSSDRCGGGDGGERGKGFDARGAGSGAVSGAFSPHGNCPTGGWTIAEPGRASAKARCPSCAGRRMNEQAAHLVDRVLPHVPYRQWVLTLPLCARSPCGLELHAEVSVAARSHGARASLSLPDPPTDSAREACAPHRRSYPPRTFSYATSTASSDHNTGSAPSSSRDLTRQRRPPCGTGACDASTGTTWRRRRRPCRGITRTCPRRRPTASATMVSARWSSSPSIGRATTTGGSAGGISAGSATTFPSGRSRRRSTGSLFDDRRKCGVMVVAGEASLAPTGDSGLARGRGV